MKHPKRRRALGLLLCTAALWSALSVGASALTPTHAVTGTYRASTYHQNLLKIPRTGDEAFDTLAVAMTQVGYHEGNSTADFDGENASGYKNYTEYNRVFGKVDGTYGYAWCAAFVSWCLRAADAADAAGGLFVSCSLWLEQLRAEGRYSSRASGYRPKAGDLIFFRSAGAGRASDHVGLVRYVEGGRVYTVEGNSSDRVSLNSYALTNTYIVGYGRPNYGGTALSGSARSFEDTAVGWYAVTHEFVNVRSGMGTAYSKVGRLNQGDVVRILSISGGWGAFEAEGKLCYVSLEYADFVSPSALRVTYDAGEGENAPAEAVQFSTEARRVSVQEPTRAGFVFVAWRDVDGKQYAAGDPLPARDLTLTAVWEVLPVAEEPEKAPDETPPEMEAPPAEEEQGSADTELEGAGSSAELLAPPGEPTPPDGITEPAAYTAADGATAVALTLGVGGGVTWYALRRRKRV